jgi:hypothetical protein
MRVRIPDALRVEPIPGCLYQFVPGERRRQTDAAGIPEALLRPESPRRKRGGAGERGSAEQQVASFQERRRTRQANS